MDSAVRDLERLEEEHEAHSRRLGTILLASLATVGLVLAMGVVLGDAGADAVAPERDPLLALSDAAEQASEPTEPAELPEVDRASLAFPETLSGYDGRAEVDVAVAAAAAELAHPDPLPSALGDLAVGQATTMAPLPVDDSLPTHLPAGTAFRAGAQALTRDVRRDPLVATSFPLEAPERPAPAGRDGKYTLQVISYETPQEAELFAQALRARGHKAFVLSADIPGRGRYHRVRIGPFETAREAETYRASFEEQERMNTFIFRQREG